PAGRDRHPTGRRHPADRCRAEARPRDARAGTGEHTHLPRRRLDRLRPPYRRSPEAGPEDRRPGRHRRLHRHHLGTARLDGDPGCIGQSDPAESSSMTTLSPLDYAVISQALIAGAREMGVKLIRSAYSTILREARDGSAGLMDRHGNTVAQSELIPMQL